jgi:hypothetical protein
VHIADKDGLVHVTVAAPLAGISILRPFTVHGEAVEADEAAIGGGMDAAPAP